MIGTGVLCAAHRVRRCLIMMVNPAKAWLLILGFSLGVPASAIDASSAAGLPHTVAIEPNGVVGPFDAKQAKEWRDAAGLLCSQSRYGEAEKLYAKLLDEREHALGLNSPELASDLNDLGRVSFAQNKYAEAASDYARELQIMEMAKGREDMAVVAPLEKLARVYRMLEKYPEAEQYARRAVEIVEKTKGPEALALAPELISHRRSADPGKTFRRGAAGLRSRGRDS